MCFSFYTTLGVLFFITLGCVMCPPREAMRAKREAHVAFFANARYCIHAERQLQTRNGHDIEIHRRGAVKTSRHRISDGRALDWSLHACDRACRNVPTSLLLRCLSKYAIYDMDAPCLSVFGLFAWVALSA